MNKRTFVVASLAGLIASAMSAPGTPTGQAGAMVSFSFQFLKDGAVVEGGMTISGPDGGEMQLGRSMDRAAVRCGAGQARLDTVRLFDGIKVGHRVLGETLVVEVTKFDVIDKDAEIQALNPGQCQELLPVQRTAFQQTLRLPTKPAEPVVVPLGQGYGFRYQVFPPMIGRND